MTLVLAFLLMLIIVAAMSLGVIMGRKPIAGSCGGMKTLGLNGGCEVCGRTPGSCETDGQGMAGIPEAREQARALATDAAAPDRGAARTL